MADAARIQTRIDWLKKNKPGDPEIRQLQQKLKALQAQPAAPEQPVTPFESGQPVTPPTFGGTGQPVNITPPPGASDAMNNLVSNVNAGQTTQPKTPDPAADFGKGVADGVQPTTPAQGNTAPTPPVNPPPVGGSFGLEQPTQDLLGDQTGLGTFGTKLATNLIGSLPGDTYDPNSIKNGIPTANSEDRAKVEDAVYANLTRDLDQNFKQDYEAKKQELADRGIPVGSQAYNTEMDRLQKGYDRQKLEARNQAIQYGGQELVNQFGLGMQSHNTEMGDYQSRWSFPTSVAGSLMGFGQSALGSYADLWNIGGGIQQKTADREQEKALTEKKLEQDFEVAMRNAGLTELQIRNEMKRWRGERAMREAQIGALNRSNRGGGAKSGGGSSEDSGPGYGGAIT